VAVSNHWPFSRRVHAAKTVENTLIAHTVWTTAGITLLC